MLSTTTEKAALELIESELKRSTSLENIDVLMEKFKDAKFMFRQLCKLNVYCGLYPHDNIAKERLNKAFDDLGKELSELTWKVLNKDKPHPFGK